MFNLPQLEYDYDALEPYIDAKTMEIHHSKHHQTYVNNLNAAMESIKELDIEFYKKISKITKKDELAAAEYLVSHLENVPEKVRTAVRNNAGGHLNHSLFWKVLKPAEDDNALSANLLKKISADQGDLVEIKETFNAMALANFGSGWTWLVFDEKNDKFEIVNGPNQDSPLGAGLIPVFGIDVWEHAYYLKYQNRRAEYVDAFWEVLNFKQAEKLFDERLNS
ncbi:superoxide dismutase [Candidatus Saccharibacteria bacterium]|nr:superoxide dismutase [Candidatus Saccharibacteria bacterium]